MEQKSYENPQGCEVCGADYAVYIAFPTPEGNKDLCGACHRKLTKREQR